MHFPHVIVSMQLHQYHVGDHVLDLFLNRNHSNKMTPIIQMVGSNNWKLAMVILEIEIQHTMFDYDQICRTLVRQSVWQFIWPKMKVYFPNNRFRFQLWIPSINRVLRVDFCSAHSLVENAFFELRRFFFPYS